MTGGPVMGIDGGGSATRAVVLDGDGRELAREAGGPASPIDIDAVVRLAEGVAGAANVNLPVAALCAGLAGAGDESARDAARRALQARDLADTVVVLTDAEIAFFDAFADGPGILVIAGTGSISWGRGEDGREARAGGLGPLLGDEGSGYEIGRRALEAAARSIVERADEERLVQRLMAELGIEESADLITWAAKADRSAVAGLAPAVCEAAGAGDPAAAEIVDAAVSSLGSLVEAIEIRLGPWSTAPPLALAGGLIAPGGPLRDRVIEAASRYGCAVVDAEVDAARGAARLALRKARRRTS